MIAPLDRVAALREREANEAREAAALRMKVRGVARLLGGRFVEEDTSPSHTIELAPTVHLWARRDWKNPKMIHWGTRCPRASGQQSPSICTALSRSVVATAADVSRRLIPAAREWCHKTITNAAVQQDRELARKARLAELEMILGPMHTSSEVHYAPGFKIVHGDLLGGGYNGRVRAEIDVDSWHCLLQIARLVAENSRILAKAVPTKGEQ